MFPTPGFSGAAALRQSSVKLKTLQPAQFEIRTARGGAQRKPLLDASLLNPIS
jgi:hypothetical protein